MNRDDIIRMAREAGLQHEEAAEEIYSLHYTGIYLDDLERFAALVASAEREAICQLADDMLRGVDALPLIEAIRARGQE